VTPPAEKPPFPEDEASSLLGKVIVLGLTFVDEKQELIERKQMHGIIVSVDPKKGVEISLRGMRAGEKYSLPPDLRPFQQKAPPGEYRLKETGEVIIDPDYAVSWTITRRSKGSVDSEGWRA